MDCLAVPEYFQISYDYLSKETTDACIKIFSCWVSKWKF